MLFPDLLERIITQLKELGVNNSIKNQLTISAKECRIENLDLLEPVFTLFFIELGAASEIPVVVWDKQETYLSATLTGIDSTLFLSACSKTRKGLIQIGGEITTQIDESHGENLTLLFPFLPKETIVADRPIFKAEVLEEACPDNELIHTLMENLFVHLESLVQNLQEALLLENREEVHRASHSIKGGALNIGAFRLADIARTIENYAKKNQLEQIGSYIPQLQKEIDLLASAYKEYHEKKENPNC
ncbi:MAG: Hpt domain-containing protein [Spirochaetales bacterium]